jgi:hypothetical protein
VNGNVAHTAVLTSMKTKFSLRGFLQTTVDLVYNCFNWANSSTFYTNSSTFYTNSSTFYTNSSTFYTNSSTFYTNSSTFYTNSSTFYTNNVKINICFLNKKT